MRSKTCVITKSGRRVCGKPVSRASGAPTRADDERIRRLAKRAAAHDCIDAPMGAEWWVGEMSGDLGIVDRGMIDIHGETARQFTREYKLAMRRC